MKLRLYYNSEKRPYDKYDLPGIFSQIGELEKLGLPCERIDTTKMPNDDIIDAYGQAILPSVYRKYRIRQVFGSRRNSGWLFGKQVPALLVFEKDGKYPTDVYPHEEHGTEVTISKCVGVTKQQVLRRLSKSILERLTTEGIPSIDIQPQLLETGEFVTDESWLRELPPEKGAKAAQIIREEMKFWSERYGSAAFES